MAFSWEQQIYPAGAQNVTVSIAYLDKSFIYVYLDGVLTTNYTWASDAVIRLDTPLTATTEVLLVRRTEKEYLFIEFAAGAPFISDNLDTQNTQFLHLAQEMVEGRSIEGFYGDISMNGYRIMNLGSPVNPRDAATKQYVDTNVSAEASIRASADLTERNARIAGDNAEANARAAGDAALQSQISGATPVLSAERSIISWHGQHLGNSVDIPDNSNAFTVGPVVTVDPGQEITVGDGSFWTILDGKTVSGSDYTNLIADTITTADGTKEVHVPSLVQSGDLSSMAHQDANAVAITGGNISGIVDLAVADGGTGASTAAAARNNLGAAPLDSPTFTGTVTVPTISLTNALPVTMGGTGASNAAQARTNLAAANSGNNSNITQLSGLTTYSPLPGINTGVAAAAGVVGEVLNATLTGTDVATNTPANLVQLTLTPGDWDVVGIASVRPAGATVTRVIAGTVTTSAGTPVFPDRLVVNGSDTTVQEYPVPVVRMNVSVNTTIYLSVTATFASGTVSGDGYLRARRVR